MGMYGDRERRLSAEEEKLIRAVFRTTKLPALDSIRIRDGLSPTGTAFTVPTDVGKGFQPQAGAYWIMVGPSLFEGDVATTEPDTLVHEMVHVWQYYHGTLNEIEAAIKHVGAAALNAISNNNFDLYEYKIGGAWGKMTFEGQAQLVQDWYTSDLMSETCDRWLYVKYVLMMGDVKARWLTLGELMLSNPGVPDVEPDRVRQVVYEDYPFREGYLQELLDKVIPASDVKRLASRVRNLNEYFRQLNRLRNQEALDLARRLQARKAGDRLAQAFHYRLKTSTRERLIKVLLGLP